MATVYNTEIVRDGLTFYMDMMNAKSYSGTGNKINDLSGLEKNATIFNNLPFDSNQNGGAFNFQADSSEYIRIDSDFLIPSSASGHNSLREPFTLSMWIQRIGGGTIVSRASGNRSLQMRFAGGGTAGGKIALVNSMHENIGTFDNSALKQNKTYNITLTREASGITSTFKLYMNGTTTNPDDGTTIGTLTYTSLFNADTDTIGRNPNGEPVNAYVYAVSSYSRVLTDVEILQNFNALKHRYSNV